MDLKQVKNNTWVLDSWELIPLYKVDDSHCILLDTGVEDQREELEEALRQAGLTPVGILCSHAHLDHAGSNAYFQKKYGATVALTLGEAGQCFSSLSMHLQYHNLNHESFQNYPELREMICMPDCIILPHENEVELCGVRFQLIRTPGHTCDHICIRTPDDVLYLGDAMMTGRVLHWSKFPYAFSMGDYLDSLGMLRSVSADWYVVAHKGVYREILPFIDLELRFLTQRMGELLGLVGESTTPKEMTRAICHTYRVAARNVRHLAYFEHASETFLHYLVRQGWLEPYVDDCNIRYRKTEAGERVLHPEEPDLPPTGQFK